MGVNLDKLREGLKQYNSSLLKHNRELSADFKSLQLIFERLASVYEGEAAEVFIMAWTSTADWFERYLDETSKLNSLLEERLDALDRERST